MTTIILLKENDDGSLLGADENGNLYDGTKVSVPFDKVTVTTTLTDDGFERVTSYGDHVIAKGTTNKQSFYSDRQTSADDLAARYAAQREAKGDEKAPPSPTSEQVLDAWWDQEVAIDKHEKAYYDMPPGMELIEKTYNLTDWKAR